MTLFRKHLQRRTRQKLWAAGVLVAVISLLSLNVGSRNQAADWRRSFRTDLAAIHAAIRDHHPGSVDVGNPAFAAWLKDGLRAVLKHEAQITNAATYFLALTNYVTGFNDTHLALEPKTSLPPPKSTDREKRVDYGPAAKRGWSEPEAGVVWIGIPSFDYGETNAAALRKIMDRLASEAERIRQSKAIVFDLRGNQGGSSLWGDEVRNILWYPEDITKYSPRDPSGVDWRASAGNRDFMLALLSTVIPKVGSQSETGLALTSIARGLSASVAAGLQYWREGNPKPPKEGGLTQRRPKAVPPLFPARIVLLANGTCVSACLDFADRLLQMPGTFIVGGATGGDGQYTETRTIALPSGQADLHLPMKVYRGRQRGPMEHYDPDLRFDGSWSDGSVKSWLLEAIAKGKLRHQING